MAFIGVKSLILTNRYRREKRNLPELGSSNWWFSIWRYLSYSAHQNWDTYTQI